MKCGCTETTPCNKLGCGCKFKVDAGCITYSGADLTAAGFVSGDSLTTILTTINQNFVDYGPGDYITMTTEAPGSHCQYGGLRLDLRSGQTNAIKSTQYLCGVNSGLQLSGSGTLNTLPLWTPNGNTLGDSIVTQDGNKAIVNGYLQIIDGSQGNGKVFVSDANGVGSWQTITSSGGIALTDLSGTTPITYNNLTGAIGIQVANTSQGGYLTSADWNMFNGKGYGDLLKNGTVALTNHWNAGSFTITSNKLVSNTDATINGMTVGMGGGNIYTNTVVGYGALVFNTTGLHNTAIGNSALSQNSGSYNTAIGSLALRDNASSIGSDNTAVGMQSLLHNYNGSQNTAIGSDAMTSNTTGIENTAIGASSLVSNTTGSYNIAIGLDSLKSAIVAIHNIGIGCNSLNFATTSNNIAIGPGAGAFLSDNTTHNTNPTFSIFIGSNAYSLTAADHNQIVIGTLAKGNGSNTTTIGNTATTNTYLHGDFNLKNATAPTTAAVTQTKYLPVTINGVAYKLLLAD